MKSTTQKAKDMTDAQLKAEGLRLRRQIPKDQALFSAIKREQRHRSEKARASLVVVLLLCLAGCTIGGEVDLDASPKAVVCTDTRDGETFTFRSKDVSNARLGLSDACMDVIDLDGRKRRLCQSHVAWLKCDPAK